MARVLRARVTKGRLVLDEPTDLPEGTEVELVVVPPSDRASGPFGRSVRPPEAAPSGRFLAEPSSLDDEPPASGGPDDIIEQARRQARG